MSQPLRISNPVVALLAIMLFATASIAQPITGWRGDGTGKYPAADPPIAWSQTSTAIKGLRYSIEKTPADAGAAMADGVIRQWLILGPMPGTKGQPEDDATPEESAADPQAGDKWGDKTWTKADLDTAWLDFNKLLPKRENDEVVAYAFTRVFAPAAGKFRLNFTAIAGGRLYINGQKPKSMGAHMLIDLAKGWNRILLRIAPADTDWYAVPVIHAAGKCDYERSGIAWRTSLPAVHPGFYGGGMGVGSPVIVGDNIYLLSEPHDLICLSKADGKLLWIRRASFFEAATDADQKDPAYADAKTLTGKIDSINASVIAGTASPAHLEEKGKLEAQLQKQMKQVNRATFSPGPIPDVGNSGLTPATDGKFIYAFFTDGLSASFTLDGQIRWIRVDPHAAVEHGFSSSPVLAEGKFIVFMRDLMAFDAATGKPLWRTPLVAETGFNPGAWFHGSLISADIGGQKVIATGNGAIVRVSDGKLIGNGLKPTYQSVSSPIIDGRQLLTISNAMDLSIRTLPVAITDPLPLKPREIPIDLKAFPKHYLPWHLASPLVHEGLAYLLNNAGILTVIDLQTTQVIYQRMLDLDPFQGHNEGASRGIGISPILAGGHIYLLGNNGACVVIEPGRVFKQMAKNKLESIVMLNHWSERQERFIANPVPEGNRLYLRGEEFLYCLGGK